MANIRIRSIAAMAVGFGLNRVGHTVGVWGNLDVAAGDRSAALAHHSLALFFTILALGCFVYALVTIVRGWRGGGSPPAPRFAPEPEDAPPAFDADAVMARYLATRDVGPPAVTATRGFGRKQA